VERRQARLGAIAARRADPLDVQPLRSVYRLSYEGAPSMSPERDLAYRLAFLHVQARNAAATFEVRIEDEDRFLVWQRPCESGQRFIDDVLSALDEAAVMLERLASERERTKGAANA
jgi:hypothetical protein